MRLLSSFIVEGIPPSLNHSYKRVWRYNKAGGRWLGDAKTEAAVGWQNLVQYRATLAAHENIPKHQRLLVVIMFETPVVRPDLDNMEKLTIDAVARAYGVNDRNEVAKASCVVEGEEYRTTIDILEAPEVRTWHRSIIEFSRGMSIPATCPKPSRPHSRHSPPRNGH